VFSVTDSGVLITGSSGFTGKHILRILKSKSSISKKYIERSTTLVNLLSKQEIYKYIDTYQPHTVLHLAGISNSFHFDPDHLWQVNTVGTENLMRAFIEHGTKKNKRFILASSAAVYAPSQNAIEEDHPTSPNNLYGHSKLAAEKICNSYQDYVKISIIRPFNYTGVGQNPNFIIPKIVQHLKMRSPELILGNLDVSRDFSDVRDVARSYVTLVESPEHNGTFNFCSGKALKINEIICMLEELTRFTIEVKQNEQLIRHDEPNLVLGNSLRFDKLFNIKKISFQDTLKWMIGL
jgi:nucleoside-diphosphate-sugar epimerase